MYFWTVAIVVFVIWFLSREPYFYDFFVSCKDWVKEFISRQWKSFRSFSALKQTYIAAGAIGLALLVLFVVAYLQIVEIPFNPSKLNGSELRNLAITFIDKYHFLFAVFCFVVYLVSRAIYLHPSDIEWQKEWTVENFWQWSSGVPLLKKVYVIVAGVIGLALFVLFITLYLEIFFIEWDKFGVGDDNSEAVKDNDETLENDSKTVENDSSIRNLAIAFLGTITGIGALFGVYMAILKSETTERQTYTEEQGLITDRLNKATEGLGKIDTKEPVIEVRLGALYALERIAQDSLRDHVQIMEILCAYIRHNSPRTNKTDNAVKPAPLREDIHAAIAIIGRRGDWLEGDGYLKKEQKQKYQIDLRNCDLHGAQLNDANFSNALLDGANLKNAQLNNANLEEAQLDNAKLNHATFNQAKMTNASFDNADLRNARSYYADMSYANFNEADLRDARIGSAKLCDATFSDAKMNHMRLINSDMNDAWFDGTNLSNAVIINTDFTNARLLETNLKNTNLNRSFAYKGDFSDCKNFTKKQLKTIFCGESVEIPTNWKKPEHWPKDEITREVFMRKYAKWLRLSRRILRHKRTQTP